MIASKHTMQNVSADEWADFVSNFRTYQTEETWRTGYSVMYSKLAQGHGDMPHGYVIAEVHYVPDGSKGYFIERG